VLLLSLIMTHELNQVDSKVNRSVSEVNKSVPKMNFAITHCYFVFKKIAMISSCTKKEKKKKKKMAMSWHRLFIAVMIS